MRDRCGQWPAILHRSRLLGGLAARTLNPSSHHHLARISKLQAVTRPHHFAVALQPPLDGGAEPLERGAGREAGEQGRLDGSRARGAVDGCPHSRVRATLGVAALSSACAYWRPGMFLSVPTPAALRGRAWLAAGRAARHRGHQLRAPPSARTSPRRPWSTVAVSVGQYVHERCTGCIAAERVARRPAAWARWHSGKAALPDDAQVLAMPALSPTMEAGKIAAWLLEEGEAVSEGGALCEIETDKATVALEATDEGVLARVLRPASDTDVRVGEPIAVIVEDASDIAAVQAADLSHLLGGAAAEAEATEPAAAPSAAPAAAAAAPRLMPAARHLAASRGIDVTGLTGTGKHGMLTKGDILAVLRGGAGAAESAAAPADAAPTATTKADAASDTEERSFADTKPSAMRRVIAARLTESKSTVPHAYAAIDVSMGAVLRLRSQLTAAGVKTSVNDFVIRASALALRDVPEANSYFDVAAGAVAASPAVDVSVAVATEGGLITPIIRGADTKGLAAVHAEVADLASRARAGKLLPEEYQGGTFTISNLGMFGVDFFSAVINPPQAAILAVGGGTRRVVLDESGQPTVETAMSVQISADRRVVDDVVAGQLLAAFKAYMDEPALLLA